MHMFSTAFGTIMIKCYTIHDVTLLSRKEGKKRQIPCAFWDTINKKVKDIPVQASAGKWKRQMMRIKKRKKERNTRTFSKAYFMDEEYATGKSNCKILEKTNNTSCLSLGNF